MKTRLLLFFGFFFGASFCSVAQTVNANSVVFLDPTSGVNSDNTLMYRSDLGADYTRLRLQLGDEESALFEMGYPYYSTGQWTNMFTIDGYGNGYFRGNMGIGTSTPATWFGNTKVLELAYNRPVLKLNSTANNDLATIFFTNSAVDASSHAGEFHMNYQYDASNANASALRFYAYPGGEQLTLKANGNIGVGLVDPANKLDIGGTLRATDYILGTNYVSVVKSGSYRVSMNGQTHGYISGRNDSSVEKFLISSNGNSYFNGGNVGIGTSSPTTALTVNGTIYGKEVRVDVNVPPDYVFEQDYRLISLEEVQAYIEQHKHLPEVPSAKEMIKNGVDVGEMEMILLKKIEELTLYMIDLKKENKSIKTENDELKKLILERLSALENNTGNK